MCQEVGQMLRTVRKIWEATIQDDWAILKKRTQAVAWKNNSWKKKAKEDTREIRLIKITEM